MKRFAMLLVALLALPANIYAQNTTAEQARAAMIAKIDALFGQRYTLSAEVQRSIAIESALEGPQRQDAVIYWSGANHVVVFNFATNGTLKKIELIPETWLHGIVLVDRGIELSPGQIGWLVEIADRLQPVAKVQNKSGPDFCTVSGANRYCSNEYEHASVGQYWRYEQDTQDRQSGRYSLKSMSIVYN